MPRVIGTVADLAESWLLRPRLAGAAEMGAAYEACLDATVEASGGAKTQAGIAYSDERRIVLNSRLLVAGRERDRDATLLHECAHILANIHHRRNCRHNQHWRRVMATLGEPAQVGHDIEYLSRKTHAVETWVCGNCDYHYHFVRRPRRRIEECYCRTCGPKRGRLSARGKPTW